MASQITTDAPILQRHLEEVIGPTWNFSKRLVSPQDHFLNAVVGLAAEAGELLDEHKKIWFHTRRDLETQREAILSEHGDVLYYYLKSLDLHFLTVEEVLAYNRRKLASRHPELGEVSERFGKEAL
jgi:NTP pyrophosphatase (non-canonical NTP hydrolase)